eukprot:CAMPEP_0174277968 /NCGR_PEP_ID=MMETSP0439-20130205/61219_1 /TAXON_ID=0 /ORGANISM="Stereomyxa ramosa, Strain Chinc5" /LENGTH=252 /DNA_ID=CAMNT_0015370333 /DNA_START=1141 /DNA_END=1899 /DNA_ORIENTATION=-
MEEEQAKEKKGRQKQNQEEKQKRKEKQKEQPKEKQKRVKGGEGTDNEETSTQSIEDIHAILNSVPSALASAYCGSNDPIQQINDPYWKENQPFYWELLEEDDGQLSELDSSDIEKYMCTEEEVRVKEYVWEETNKEYLAELKAKLEQEAIDFPDGKPQTAKRRRRRGRSKQAAGTAAEAAKQVLEKKTSSKINYQALKDLFDSSSNTEIGGESEKGKNRTKYGDGDGICEDDGFLEELDAAFKGNRTTSSYY